MEVRFRNHTVEVVIDRDYGYEPDTNSHEVDWHFLEEEDNQPPMTIAEEQDVMEQILDVLRDPHYYDESDLL